MWERGSFSVDMSQFRNIRTESWAGAVVPSWSPREKDSSDVAIGF